MESVYGKIKRGILLSLLAILLIFVLFVPKRDTDLVRNGRWVCRNAPIVIDASGDSTIELDGKTVYITFVPAVGIASYYEVDIKHEPWRPIDDRECLFSGAYYTAFGKLILIVDDYKLWVGKDKVLIFDNIATE